MLLLGATTTSSSTDKSPDDFSVLPADLSVLPADLSVLLLVVVAPSSSTDKSPEGAYFSVIFALFVKCRR